VLDLLSSEYGWTTEYILNRTLVEIKWRTNAILERRNDNAIFEMKLHDKKPAGGYSQQEPLKLDKNQEEALEIARRRAMERKAREYGRKISNQDRR